jgi:hypothetical protein
MKCNYGSWNWFNCPQKRGCNPLRLHGDTIHLQKMFFTRWVLHLTTKRWYFMLIVLLFHFTIVLLVQVVRIYLVERNTIWLSCVYCWRTCCACLQREYLENNADARTNKQLAGISLWYHIFPILNELSIKDISDVNCSKCSITHLPLVGHCGLFSLPCSYTLF